MRLRNDSEYIPLPGVRGDEGPAGPGVPTGGTTGQVLAKTSSADYATTWVNQSGGGGTSDYDDLTDKPSINNVTLSGNKTAADLSLGTYSKPSGGIPASDLASAVQTSLGKADTALQSVPATYRTAAAQDSIDATQDAAIGVVITGKRPSMVVTAGQYVIVRNSTISGISDGLYTASASLSPSTDVTAANLTAVSNGGLNSIKSKIEDSGWQYPTFNTGWSNYGTDDPTIKYRKVGKMVEVSGCVKPDGEKAIGEHTVLTLPSGYRPSSSIYTVCTGSNINKILARVDAYGNLKVSRYGSASITTIPTGAWLAIHITYCAD